MTIKEVFKKISDLEFCFIAKECTSRDYIYYGTKKIKLMITTDITELLVSEISVVEIDSNFELDFWCHITSCKSLPNFFSDLEKKFSDFERPKKYLLF